MKHTDLALDLHKEIMQILNNFSLKNTHITPQEFSDIIDLSLVTTINSTALTFELEIIDYWLYLVEMGASIIKQCEEHAASLEHP